MAARTKPGKVGLVDRALRRVGLARLLRLGVAGSIPAVWLEISVLHFRGSFQSPPMWVPVAALPAVFVAGVATTLVRDEDRSRRLFRPLAWLLTVIGGVGTFFHIRGVSRQMGGLANWKYNFTTGPPFPAPVEVALFGLVGALASAPRQRDETSRLITRTRMLNTVSYLFFVLEAGYSHWLGGFFSRLMYIPLAISPLMAFVHLAAARRARFARRAELPLSALATALGLVGFWFHVRNIARRHGGFSWQNVFYGPPAVAPLQLSGQGILGVLTAIFDRRS